MKLKTAIAMMILTALVLPVSAEQHVLSLDGPAGFILPPLHPDGTTLVTKPLGNDVYALLSNHPGVDNSGFIVGERGVPGHRRPYQREDGATDPGRRRACDA